MHARDIRTSFQVWGSFWIKAKKLLHDWWEHKKQVAFHDAPAKIVYHPWVARLNRVVFIFAKNYPELFVCWFWGWALGWPLTTLLLIWWLL